MKIVAYRNFSSNYKCIYFICKFNYIMSKYLQYIVTNHQQLHNFVSYNQQKKSISYETLPYWNYYKALHFVNSIFSSTMALFTEPYSILYSTLQISTNFYKTSLHKIAISSKNKLLICENGKNWEICRIIIKVNTRYDKINQIQLKAHSWIISTLSE